MTIETERLRMYAASREQMEAFIATQSVDVLKAAYTEMLNNCLSHPDQWAWYAIWMMERKDGTHVGELCFKGVTEKGVAEIGYGVAESHRGRGYATEAVSALTEWALAQSGVTCVVAETETSNVASRKVLAKAGFVPTGEAGAEGPLYINRRRAGTEPPLAGSRNPCPDGIHCAYAVRPIWYNTPKGSKEQRWT